MLTLRQLIGRHSRLLLLDSASECIHAALIDSAGNRGWIHHRGEAGKTLFTAVEDVLQAGGIALAEVPAIAFNLGPGSILGIRTAAVALRTWNCVYPKTNYAFSGLQLAAAALASRKPDRSFSMIADARRESWHRVSVDEAGKVGTIERVAAQALSGALVHLDDYRHWSAMPPGVERIPNDLAAFVDETVDLPLFQPAPAPDAFLHEEPSYQTWIPQIHRAPL